MPPRAQPIAPPPPSWLPLQGTKCPRACSLCARALPAHQSPPASASATATSSSSTSISSQNNDASDSSSNASSPSSSASSWARSAASVLKRTFLKSSFSSSPKSPNSTPHIDCNYCGCLVCHECVADFRYHGLYGHSFPPCAVCKDCVDILEFRQTSPSAIAADVQTSRLKNYCLVYGLGCRYVSPSPSSSSASSTSTAAGSAWREKHEPRLILVERRELVTAVTKTIIDGSHVAFLRYWCRGARATRSSYISYAERLRQKKSRSKNVKSSELPVAPRPPPLPTEATFESSSPPSSSSSSSAFSSAASSASTQSSTAAAASKFSSEETTSAAAPMSERADNAQDAESFGPDVEDVVAKNIDLRTLSDDALRNLLTLNFVDWSNIERREDLIRVADLLVATHLQELEFEHMNSRNGGRGAPPPPSNNARHDQQQNQQQQEQHNPNPPILPQSQSSTKHKVLTVDEIVAQNIDLNTLSNAVIKHLLAANFVDRNHIVERNELLALAQRLVDAHKRDIEFTEEESPTLPSKPPNPEQAENAAPSSPAPPDPSAAQQSQTQSLKSPTTSQAHTLRSECRICMSAAPNCVLLNCGHTGLCISCAKQLAECPFCRAYIVRVIHTFDP